MLGDVVLRGGATGGARKEARPAQGPSLDAPDVRSKPRPEFALPDSPMAGRFSLERGCSGRAGAESGPRADSAPWRERGGREGTALGKRDRTWIGMSLVTLSPCSSAPARASARRPCPSGTWKQTILKVPSSPSCSGTCEMPAQCCSLLFSY